jgi:hypothetical protein
VKRDAHQAILKLKKNGLLIFNDYTLIDSKTKDDYGVVHVVNDIIVNQGFKIVGFALEKDMFCDIAIRATLD